LRENKCKGIDTHPLFGIHCSMHALASQDTKLNVKVHILSF